MSQAPPPYPGTEKAGGPPPNPAYPQQPGYNTQYGMQAPYPQTAPYPAPGPYPQFGGYQPPPPGYQGGYPNVQYPGSGYPQGPHGGYPQHPIGQTTTTVVVTQPVLVHQFRENPVHTRCPHCQAEIVTGTAYETGTLTWIACALLCIFGCDAGCCLIPFCCDGCKDVVHICPNCQQTISRWNRF